MKRVDVNLATKPFVNRRPVSRLAWLLWIVGAVLLVVNVNAYRGYFSGSDEKVLEIEELDNKIVNHETTIQELKSSLLALDLTQQNEQVDFLNRKIAERTFSWSHLFDQLEEVLPDDVRISSLTPRVTEFSQSRREADADELLGDRVSMSIVAVAKTVDAQLDMVDSFFQHPSFESPKLSSDSQTEGGSRFNLSVLYLPVRSDSQMLAENSTPKSAPTRPELRQDSRGEGDPALAAAVPGQDTEIASRPRSSGRTAGGRRDNPNAASARPPSVATAGSTDESSGAPRGPAASAGERRRGSSGGPTVGGSFGVPGASSDTTDRSSTSRGGRTRQRGVPTDRRGGRNPVDLPPDPSEDGVRPSGRIPSASSSLEPQ